MRIAAMSLVLLLACAGCLWAAKGEELSMPGQITVEGKTLVLNGTGVREATLLKVSVYTAGLYLETKSQDPEAILRANQLKRIEMRFMRDVKADQIRDAWKEGIAKNCPKPCPDFKEHVAKLNSFMSGLKNGDSMSFTFLPGRVEVQVKGQSMGSISGEDFARVLLSNWLGPNPPNKSLKEGLLGKKK